MHFLTNCNCFAKLFSFGNYSFSVNPSFHFSKSYLRINQIMKTGAAASSAECKYAAISNDCILQPIEVETQGPEDECESLHQQHLQEALRGIGNIKPLKLMRMPYTRPLSTPTVWHRFSAHGSTLRVQDLTPELYEPAIALLRTYFTRDEPPCKYIGIENHPTAMRELEQLWRKALRDNVSIVCVVDDDSSPPKVVGVNILAVACQEDKDEPFQTDDKIWAQLFGAVDLVARGVDVFQHYGVDKYLTAYGLVVDPEWRGAGVAKEILKASSSFLKLIPENCWFSDEKIYLCRSLGIKVTATVFTAKASQMAAKKAGFVDLYEITYEELAKKGCVFPGVEQDTRSSKLMALVIDN